jgi:AraC-like DNA-binding protein
VTSSTPKSHYRYFLADSRDRDWGIYATSAGYVDIAPGERYPPAGHPKRYAFDWKEGRELDEVQVHFISRGRGIFESARDGGSHPVEAGSAFLVFPRVWHRYAPLERTGWLEYWIGFRGDYAELLLRKRFFSPARPVVTLPETSGLLRLFTEAVACVRHHPPGAPRLLGSLAARVLAEMEAGASAGAAEPAENRAGRIIGEAKAMLGQHLGQDFELESLARKLNVGYHWLRSAFKRETGQSLHQYRLQLRINHAKYLLQRSDATIGQIAVRTGFENPYYFSQIFKRKTASTPSGWRRARSPVIPL